MKNNTFHTITHHFQQIMKNPHNYDSIFELALLYYGQHQYQEALAYFTQAF